MNPTLGPTWRVLLTWQFIALLLVLSLPVAILGRWPWELPVKEFKPFVWLTTGFTAAAAVHWMVRNRCEWQRLFIAVVTSAAVFSIPIALLFITRATSSRVLLLVMFAAAVVILPAVFLPPRLRKLGLVALVAAVVGVVGLGVKKRHMAPPAKAAQRLESYVSTTLYNLNVAAYVGHIPRPVVRGGGLARFGEQTLLATGDGHLYLLDFKPGALSVQTLPQRVPLNGDEFAAAAGGHYREPSIGGYGLNAAPGVQIWRFRVAGVLVQDRGEQRRIFAAHHYWRDAQQCFVIRVSTLDVDREGKAIGVTTGEAGSWRTLFESSPCIPVKGPDAKKGKNPFVGEEIGGRMSLLDDQTLLLTTGDFSFSGVESHQVFAQDPSASYGKTLKIRLDTGASEVFTLGHRNPQGLFKDSNGDLWLTEHGPKGGDELNLLRQGVNYGWPTVTYGTDYMSFVWPPNAKQGRHEGFEEPVFSWVPSIGVSNLIRVAGNRFPGWQGDLLIGSLATRSLYRARTKDHRVIFLEPLNIARRVRDVMELEDGRIVVWTDEAALLEITQASGMNGALLFGSMCANCHSKLDGISHRAGPDLFGIVNREVAAAPNFPYSAALSQLAGSWSEQQLDRFLADPQAVAPGNTMGFAGIPDKEQRKLIIEYLSKGHE